jgi:hypothetical protein
MERVVPGELRDDLPRPTEDLHAALGEPPAGLGAEEGRRWREALAAGDLVGPEAAELGDQRIRHKHVSGAMPLGNLGAEPYSPSRSALGEEHIPHVEPDDLG